MSRLDPNECFHPIQTATKPLRGDPSVFVNDIRGGLKVREGVALELLAALMANPAMTGVKSGRTLNYIAFQQADLFIAAANSVALTEVPPPDADNSPPS